MTPLITRAGKGSSLTAADHDSNAAAVQGAIDKMQSSTMHLAEYFTDGQWAQVESGTYTSLTSAEVAIAWQQAIVDAEGSHELTWGKAFLKVDRPIRYYGSTRMGPRVPTMYGHGCIYPDLSIDWTATYPNRGVLESANFDYPTLPPGKGSWPNSKPDFIAATHLQNLLIEGDKDSLYATNKQRVPYFGHVAHCANEAFTAERCYANRMKVSGWLLSGLQSTPTLRECGGFNNGREQNTVLGAAVTRTTGGAFGAQVTVWDGTNLVASPSTYVEAANSTDVSTIIAGNVLTINGVGYTVSSVGTGETINERTIISAAVTTTRYIRRVTFSTDLPVMTQGRWAPAATTLSYHPQGAGFASGQSAAVGGQGDAGMVILHIISGDFNQGALIASRGRFIGMAFNPKGENNPSLLRIHCAEENGGNGQTWQINGYRCDGDGSYGDQSLVRVIGHLGRPSVKGFGKNPGTGMHAKLVQAFYDGSAADITNHGNGRGEFYWNAQSDRIMYMNGVEIWDKNVKANLHTRVNAVAETITPTHTIVLYDATGTAYRVPCRV